MRNTYTIFIKLKDTCRCRVQLTSDLWFVQATNIKVGV